MEYSIDGRDWNAIDMNEGVKFTTPKDFTEHKIQFRVKIAEGKSLKLQSNGGNEITQDGEYYTFQFTRVAYQGLPHKDNIANVSFDLSTQ